MNEMTTESLEVMPERVQLPSKSVFTPIVVPLKMTLANITGSKVPASVILPFTVVCEQVKAGNRCAIKHTSEIIFHLDIPECESNRGFSDKWLRNHYKVSR